MTITYKTPIGLLTIDEIHAKIANGEYSFNELYEYCSDNMDRFQWLNAIVTRMPHTNELKDGPLKGIPIIIKDNICTKNIPTMCSSSMLKDFIPPYDATVVTNLREAGAVLMGKSNLDEFAMGAYGTHGTGMVYSPWTLIHETPIFAGGSSSGSAAAVASGMALAALGTDTGGSTRLPASWCGIVGLKPTYGVCSRFGVIAYASSLDTVGILARNIEDCFKVWNVIKSEDPNDSTSVAYIIPKIVSKKRVAVLSNLCEANDSISQAFKETIDFLTAEGWEICYLEVPHVEFLIMVYYILACTEAMSNLARFDGIRYGHNTYEDPEFQPVGEVDLNDYYSKIRSSKWGPEVRKRILAGTFYSNSNNNKIYYEQANIIRQELCDFFEKQYDQYDFFLTPISNNEAINEEIWKTQTKEDEYNTDIKGVLANLVGIPAISMPIKICPKKMLPLGIQIMAPPFGEKNLYEFCKMLENQFPVCHMRDNLIFRSDFTSHKK